MRRSGVKLPRNLIAAAREEGRDHWLVALPSIIGRLSSESSLTMKAPFSARRADRVGWALLLP